jgi:hypothetical protein
MSESCDPSEVVAALMFEGSDAADIAQLFSTAPVERL